MQGTNSHQFADSGRGGSYLLTWTTYGSWLPGDERGYVSPTPDEHGDYVIHNIPGEPYDFDQPKLRTRAGSQQQCPTVRLNQENARVCIEAFREAAQAHDLRIGAGAVMTTHIHLVVQSESDEGARLLNLFKGVSSRRLTQRFGRPVSSTWWTRHGSRRLPTNDRAVRAALEYVWNQPLALIVFDYESTMPPANAPS